jgi:hypothetical protein
VASFSLFFNAYIGRIISEKLKVRIYRLEGSGRVLIAAIDWNGLQTSQLPLV